VRTYRYQEHAASGEVLQDEQRPVVVSLAPRGGAIFLELQEGGEKDRGALAEFATRQGLKWLPGAEGWRTRTSWKDDAAYAQLRMALEEDGFAILEDRDTYK
jgi:hypothetical protein